MVQPGDHVRITTKNSKEEGILMPSGDEKIVLIKLINGYNLGFERAEIERIDLIVKGDAPTTKINAHSSLSHKPNLPTITILHTGGTIASKVDYRTGGVATQFTPQDLVDLFPELNNIANIDSELIAQMWSDDLRFAHFKLIAQKIEEHVRKGVKGIIIGMGTDNLAVGAAALSFIVESSPIPIIFVGAQRSSDRGSSDAAMNLICAAQFIAKSDFGGVAICMHAHETDDQCAILPANKTYKLHTSRRDAFHAVNTTPYAHVDYTTREICMLRGDYPRHSSLLVIKSAMEEKVGLLKIHVNMFPEQFEMFKGYKGLIIEGTGLGHTPGQVPNDLCLIHKEIYPALRRVIESGCVVVMTSQCLYGGVNLNVYDKGRDLLQLGVISGQDMLANTALVKLSWLLANYKPQDVKKLIGENLRGEIADRLLYEPEYI